MRRRRGLGCAFKGLGGRISRGRGCAVAIGFTKGWYFLAPVMARSDACKGLRLTPPLSFELFQHTSIDPGLVRANESERVNGSLLPGLELKLPRGRIAASSEGHES